MKAANRKSRRELWDSLPDGERWKFVADDLDDHDEQIEEIRRTASKMIYAVMAAAVTFAGQLVIVLETLKGK